MSPSKNDDACPVDKSAQSKLVRSTDLPLNGNPYPPKDVILNETPGYIEQTITSARTAVQPLFSPIGQVFTKAGDVVSIGIAHSQSAFQNLSENQGVLTSGLIMSGSALFGLLLARRKGVIKKFFYTTTFLAGSAAFCNQDAARKYIEIGWVMAKNNLPALASSQYEKLSSTLTSSGSSSNKDNSESNQSAEKKN